MATAHVTSGPLSPDRLAGVLARSAHRAGDLLSGLEVRLAVRRLERDDRRAHRTPDGPGLGVLGVAARTGRPAWQQRGDRR